MGSYSLGSLLLANGGNALHSIYILSLPPGPIWILHGFHVVVTLFMASWYLRHEGWPWARVKPRFQPRDRPASEPSTTASRSDLDPLTIL